MTFRSVLVRRPSAVALDRAATALRSAGIRPLRQCVHHQPLNGLQVSGAPQRGHRPSADPKFVMDLSERSRTRLKQ